MLSYDAALRTVVATVQTLKPRETATAVAGGRILAEAAMARWDMPRCNNSAMDGYAVRGGDCRRGAHLEVIGAAYAGHPFSGTLASGQAIRITTGAALPANADTVIPLEDAEEAAGRLSVRTATTVGQHVRRQGEEFTAGYPLLHAGTLLQAGEIGLLACAGVASVIAFPRPRVAIVSTGDELVELGSTPRPDQVVNSNQHYLKTRLGEYGCETTCIGTGDDDPAALAQCLAKALDADLIITTGGVSVGEKDHIQAALSRHDFQKHFWKVAIKPGKPLLFGSLGNKPFFGLPGNPAAMAATFELFVRPALKIMAGHMDSQPQKRSGILCQEVKGGGERQVFVWCRLEWHDGRYAVRPCAHQGSGQNRSIQGANALLTLPVGTAFIAQGASVEVFMLGNAL